MNNTEQDINKVFKNINTVLSKRAEQSAIYTAGLFVKGSAQKLTPIDTGALKASAYVRPLKGSGVGVRVGFTQNYAVFVHERVELFHRVGQAKFLSTAVFNNKAKIEKIIGRKIKVTLDTDGRL